MAASLTALSGLPPTETVEPPSVSTNRWASASLHVHWRSSAPATSAALGTSSAQPVRGKLSATPPSTFVTWTSWASVPFCGHAETAAPDSSVAP